MSFKSSSLSWDDSSFFEFLSSVDVGKVDISIDSGLVKDETGGEDTIEDLEALMTMLELLAADDVELFETEMAAVVALMIGGGVVITRAWEDDVKNLPFSECSPAEVLWPSVGRGFSHFPGDMKKKNSVFDP